MIIDHQDVYKHRKCNAIWGCINSGSSFSVAKTFLSILFIVIYICTVKAQSCVNFIDQNTMPKTFLDNSTATGTFSGIDNYSEYTSCGTTVKSMYSGSDNVGSLTVNFSTLFTGIIEVSVSAQNIGEKFNLYDTTNSVYATPVLTSGCLGTSGSDIIATTNGNGASGGVVTFSITNSSAIVLSFFGSSTGILFNLSACKDTCPTVAIVPNLSTTSLTNICPATTADLSIITADNTPTNGTLTWHTELPATMANSVKNTTMVIAGIYEAAFYYANSNCFSDENGTGTTTVTVTTPACCDAGTNAPLFN